MSARFFPLPGPGEAVRKAVTLDQSPVALMHGVHYFQMQEAAKFQSEAVVPGKGVAL